MLNYTEHAKKRMQQRGIKKNMVELLLQIGKSSHCSQGAHLIHLNKESRRKLSKELPTKTTRYLEENSIYVIRTHRTILTVGHRYKRIKNS